jgi:hypothetical protein
VWILQLIRGADPAARVAEQDGDHVVHLPIDPTHLRIRTEAESVAHAGHRQLPFAAVSGAGTLIATLPDAARRC